MSLAVVIFMACGGGSGDGGSDDTNSESKLEELDTPKTTALIGSEGGDITVPYDDELIAGTTLTIPAGAVDTEVTFSIQGEPEGTGPYTLKEAAEAEPTFYSSLVDHAIDNVENLALHPMYEPLLLISSESFTGYGVRFGPAKQTFNSPVTASVPLDVLSMEPDNNVIAMLQSDNGTWEALRADINTSTNMLDAKIPHFSSLRTIISDMLFGDKGLLPLSMTTNNNGDLLPNNTFDDFLSKSLCSISSLDKNLNNVRDEKTLLGDLFASNAARKTDTDKLRVWIESQVGKVAQNSISLTDLLAEAIEQKNGNIYQALITTHGLLQTDRGKSYLDKVMENFRGDGADESGARYHFMGAALHAFVHEYNREQNIFSPYDPTLILTIEELYSHSHLIYDVTEYYVDLKGSLFGRELYRKVQGKSKEELIKEFNLNDDSCYNYTYSYKNPASAEAQTHISSVSNMVIRDEGAFIYWHPRVRPIVLYTEKETAPGILIYHFNFPGIIKQAKLYAPIHTFSIGPLGRGRGLLFASNDGVTWQQLIEINPPEPGGYNVESYNAVLPDSLNGTKDLWFKIELYQADDDNLHLRDEPYGGTITSQFSRAWPEKYPDSKVFELKVNHE